MNLPETIDSGKASPANMFKQEQLVLLGMVVHTYNPRTGEAEAGELLLIYLESFAMEQKSQAGKKS